VLGVGVFVGFVGVKKKKHHQGGKKQPSPQEKFFNASRSQEEREANLFHNHPNSRKNIHRGGDARQIRGERNFSP